MKVKRSELDYEKALKSGWYQFEVDSLLATLGIEVVEEDDR